MRTRHLNTNDFRKSNTTCNKRLHRMNRGQLNIFKSLIWTPKNLPVSMWNTSCGVVHFTKYYSQKVDKKEKVYLKNKENLCNYQKLLTYFFDMILSI